MSAGAKAMVPLEVLQQLNEVRDQLAHLANMGVTDPVLQSMGTTLTKGYNLFEKIIEYVATKSQTEQSKRYKKPLGESHCVSNLKVLGSDRAEFKVWNEKLINAMTQTLGRPWRK